MSMADRDGVIWLDGEMVPWRDAELRQDSRDEDPL